MNRKEILYGIVGLVLGISMTLVFAGSRTNYGMMSSRTTMMGSNNTAPSSQQVAQIKQEEEEGQKLLQEVKSNAKSCKDLSEDNFEKIGDYVMRQRVGSSERHAAMDANIEQMMGKDQNVQMHTSLGKNAAGCTTSSNTPTNGGIPMMNKASGN
ncbi:hypothetical protein BH11PAT1_BH11PAT1_6130 [soil metagenome]